MAKTQIYTKESVLDAARRRISAAFDDFPNVSVSISGGKDSTVLCHLVLSEAARRGRKAEVFFLDEEVDYEATIRQVEYLMFEMMPEAASPQWFQVPFHLTNATSLTEGQLVAWEPGKSKAWMRQKDPRAYHHWPYDKAKLKIANRTKGFGFYDALRGYNDAHEDTCFFVGLRATESPNRWRTVSKNPGHADWCWTTRQANGNVNAYPLYDWLFTDIWKYIHDAGIRYNRIYDLMWKKGMHTQEIRVSSLIHERSFRALAELPEFEPKTYDRLCRRITGIQTANLYAKESVMMKCRKLPKAYGTWREYRDFLLSTYPMPEYLPIFRRRFAAQLENEYVARQQCRQLLLNDYENDLPVRNREDPREETIRKWASIL